MDTDADGDQKLDDPPKYGLKMKLNHKFTVESKQNVKPRPKQILEMIPLFARYIKYYADKKMHKKLPIMDFINLISAQHIYGCPLGGIGGGTIGRGFKGEFCRFQISPGIYEYVTVPECQFIVNIKNNKKETLFQSVLSTYDKPNKAPSTWEWNLNGEDCQYTALYPRAWTTYNLSQYGIILTCRQISPVIPHNYKDSSLPCAVFVFTAKNISNEPREVSITFTWTEILLGSNKKNSVKLDLERYAEEHSCGVTLEQKIGETPFTFTIAKRKQETETIHDSYCFWNAAKTSAYVWECIDKKGKVEPDPSLTPQPPKVQDKKDETNDKKCKPKKIYKCDSMALSSVISLSPNSVGNTEFSLAWDSPLIKYKKEKKVHKRYYTKYFGSDGIAGASIASYAIRNYKNWEKLIEEWQHPILNNNNIPDWLKSALMNELYYVADGGTLWFDVADDYPETDPRHEFGLFGYLEGHEYRMFNTYDVHFYASFALAQLWPNLQVVLQYMFRDTVSQEVEKRRLCLYDGKKVKIKTKNSIPHDLGDPEDIPFAHINAYNIHDVSEWRDLNPKFILQVLRDYRLLKSHSAPFGKERYQSMTFIDDVKEGTEDDLYSRSTGQIDTPEESTVSTEINTPTVVNMDNKPANGGGILDLLYKYRATEVDVEENEGKEAIHDAASIVWDSKQYLADMYESCVTLLRRSLAWDEDNDGLIENGGCPDQTFDAWVMTGPSAYCGGLWLASVRALRTMARILEKEDDENEFAALEQKASKSFEEKLWNKTHYKFDIKPSNANVIMADQLAGHWYLRSSGIADEVFPKDNVKKTLSTIYDNNVIAFAQGKMGAINGYVKGSPGKVDTTAIQSEEIWTGVTFGLAATMIYEGMHEEAFVTAGGLCDTFNKLGLQFETPEALYENGNHRSVAYMRPLAIWSMYLALLTNPPSHTPNTNGKIFNDSNSRL